VRNVDESCRLCMLVLDETRSGAVKQNRYVFEVVATGPADGLRVGDGMSRLRFRLNVPHRRIGATSMKASGIKVR
jgi:hypothetical protein